MLLQQYGHCTCGFEKAIKETNIEIGKILKLDGILYGILHLLGRKWVPFPNFTSHRNPAVRGTILLFQKLNRRRFWGVDIFPPHQS